MKLNSGYYIGYIARFHYRIYASKTYLLTGWLLQHGEN